MKRTEWWTLIFKNGHLDIDGACVLHLYKTRKRAEEEAKCFEPDCGAEPAQIELLIRKKTKNTRKYKKS